MDPRRLNPAEAGSGKQAEHDLNLHGATVTVPARPGLTLELHIRGKGATSSDAKTVGTCSLLRRVINQVKSS